MKREGLMPSAGSGDGPKYPSRWASLQARRLALISGRTMRGSSTHITCSRLEPICLYVQSVFSFPSFQSHWVDVHRRSLILWYTLRYWLNAANTNIFYQWHYGLLCRGLVMMYFFDPVPIFVFFLDLIETTIAKQCQVLNVVAFFHCKQ